MLQHLGRSCALCWVVLQHRQQEVCQGSGLRGSQALSAALLAQPVQQQLSRQRLLCGKMTLKQQVACCLLCCYTGWLTASHRHRAQAMQPSRSGARGGLKLQQGHAWSAGKLYLSVSTERRGQECSFLMWRRSPLCVKKSRACVPALDTRHGMRPSSSMNSARWSSSLHSGSRSQSSLGSSKGVINCPGQSAWVCAKCSASGTAQAAQQQSRVRASKGTSCMAANVSGRAGRSCTAC